MTATKDKFFKPEKIAAQDKATTTDSAARAIIEQEVIQRDRKTEALRALRMQREAEQAVAPPAPKKTRAPRKVAVTKA
ncbi:hypothetical protein [Rhizobium sp. SL42]|uniref:hypothetical protein n=1 Tax=Rhizobium sp. SL42 TaxID=2806346 RepID=UPI001F17CCB0|nr:hypothetical protein [Rhizobium sp. SL42]UJW76467.1 hypothetical protein IM739_08345 [Rhizobium sp. SL42]